MFNQPRNTIIDLKQNHEKKTKEIEISQNSIKSYKKEEIKEKSHSPR